MNKKETNSKKIKEKNKISAHIRTECNQINTACVDVVLMYLLWAVCSWMEILYHSSGK